MVWQFTAVIIVLLILIFSISKWKFHPFIALILSALFLGLILGLGGKGTVDILLEGFSSTLKWIAIVVILGAFIGEVLNETGGALRISRKILSLIGEKRLPWAMGLTGYLVSIPVFVDVAYIIFQPVTESLAKQSKTPLLVVGLSLAAGLTVSHTLMPPTPGPLALASLLEARIDRLIFINAFVAIFAVTGGVIWASFYCRRFVLPFDQIKKKVIDEMKVDYHSKQEKSSVVLLDLMPIFVPIVLMGAGAFYDNDKNILGQVLAFVSTPMVAVLIGSAIAWIQYNLMINKKGIYKLVESAIMKSALVIMITGAGGSLGYVIREAGLQDSLSGYLLDLPYLSFLLPFIVAAVFTTSTGSITVSLIGTASILGPMADSMPYSVEMMAALIGCGSFCVFHANSSFFWLLNRLHDVPVNILYRTYTLQSLIMGISGLFGVAILRLFGVY